MTDEEGNVSGFSIELLKASLSIMGYNTIFRLGSWEEVKKALEYGEVEVLPLVARTPEREDIFDFTFPYLTRYGTIVVREDTQPPNSYADLSGKTIGVMKSDSAEEFILRSAVKVNTVRTNTFDDALQLLSEGSVDAVVIQKLLAYQLINDLNLTNLFVTSVILEDFKQSFCFAVQEGNSDLLQILNEGLALAVSNGTFERIQTKWFAPDGRSILNRRIIIGGDSNYPPYEYFDPNRNPVGFNIDLSKAIAKDLGLEIEIQLASWTSTLTNLESGKIDLIQGIFFSPERAQRFTFSQPHSIVKHALITRKDSPDITSITQLKNKSIFVMKDDIMHDYLNENGLEENTRFSINQEEALLRLSNGEADCTLVALNPAYFYIEKNKIKNLKIQSYELPGIDYNYGALYKNEKLILTISEGLTNIKSSGEYREIYKKWFGSYEEIPFFEKYYKETLIVLTLLSCVIILILTWIITLKKAVQNKTLDLSESNKILEQQKENLQITIHSIIEGIIITDKNLKITEMNNVAEALTGCSISEAHNRPLDTIFKIISEDTGAPLSLKSTKIINHGSLIKPGVSKQIQISYSLSPIIPFNKECLGYIIVFRDISEEKIIEHRLNQTNKFDAIGQLTGGVAHDLNNLLSPIIGYTELLEEKFSEISEERRMTSYILNASFKAKKLIQNLLLFSKKQVSIYQPVNINIAIDEIKSLLQVTIRENIKINLNLGADIGLINGDISQIEQIFVNLILNAQDAIPKDGMISISTTEAEFNEQFIIEGVEIKPGKYIVLSIQDNGNGIPVDIQDRIFDPFFTTKGQLGTGLGLSTVYGIVKKHRGYIFLFSNKENGTTFRIYLPVLDSKLAAEQPQKTKSYKYAPNKSKTILLVEDDKMVRDLTEELLKNMDHKVIVASNGTEALKVLTSFKGEIDLLQTDIVMPGIDGNELYKKAIEIKPELKILFMSGYSDKLVVFNGVSKKNSDFISKPFTSNSLFSKIDGLLNKSPSGE
ncbi:MAG: transporter substrate-binding domain-containing protein [Spirochaetales bacterium]|nr:transporter substrate-binding domain-containing protein [Spirochaetales bacterium]